MSEEATNVYGAEIHLTETDAAQIYNGVISNLEKEVGEPLYPGDERRIYGEALTAVLVAAYSTMDDVGRQTLLRYARGEVLDAIGERLGVSRLPGESAKTILRFFISAPRQSNTIIPKGTRATSDGETYFQTDEVAVVEVGAEYADVSASAEASGTQNNGLPVGSIAALVDLIPYISGVSNITETEGGDDGEPYTKAGDDRFRERIRIAPSKRSTAGSEQSYVYWALTADSAITDVKAVSEVETIARTIPVYADHAFIGGGSLLPETLTVRKDDVPAVLGSDCTASYEDDLLTIRLSGALSGAESIRVSIDRTMEGCVKIVPLLAHGGIPDEGMLRKVLAAVNASDVRPMSDKVTVCAPQTVSYDIELTYYTTPADEAEVVKNVEGISGALERFVEWQSGALGRDLNPDMLRALILAPKWADDLTGAIMVEVKSPVYTPLSDTQVAQFSGKMTVSHKSVLGVV